MVTFALGAALVSLVLAVSVFTISRGYLEAQRERSAQRQAAADAHVIGSSLARADASASRALSVADPPANTVLLLYWNGRWYSNEGDLDDDALPPDLHPTVTGGTAAVLPVAFRGAPHLAAGVPLGDGDALYEFVSLSELMDTLRVLGTVLVACGVAATLGGAVLGRWASRRVLQPLHALAGTAAEIAGGALATRLTNDRDRDLETIIDSFNTMVDSLQRRIERERRFFGDVSHELRTPLTTLTTSIEVIHRQIDELPDRSRRAVNLASAELAHLRRLLEDLLALARAEAGLQQDQADDLSLSELIRHTVANSGRSVDLIAVDEDSVIRGHKLALERALTNLMDNADRHGHGLIEVRVRRSDDTAVVHVDDAGPGVPVADRQRIFERFATGKGARGRARGNTGLGLALVTETVAAHGGTVRCEDREGGGTRMTVTFPSPGVT